MEAVDYVVVGAGIVGLTIAAELRKRNSASKIVVLEKEDALGRHASGRNSGVLHSGIYYAKDSVKARVCSQGARLMADYYAEKKLPILRVGKVIVPATESEDAQLEMLMNRGKANGANVNLIDERQLAEIEPSARSFSGRAIHLPDTCVVDSRAVLNALAQDLREDKVDVRRGQAFRKVVGEREILVSSGDRLSFLHLVNAAGLYADRVAQSFGFGRELTMMPFKGLYYELSSAVKIKGLLYPVPDSRVPFLGIHFTRGVNGCVMVGPTAVPAWGREHYRSWRGMRMGQGLGSATRLLRLYLSNEQGFRRFAWQDGLRFLKSQFVAAAKVLVPDLKSKHLRKSDHVGIRAQLFDRKLGQLVMDFRVEGDDASTHVLNAISPAFTCSFALARDIVSRLPGL